MRRPTFLSSFLLVAFVLSLLSVAPVAASPLLIPVDPDNYALPPHALVGTWLTTSADGPASFTFEPDGSLAVDYELTLPAAYQAVAYLSPATGTWLPAGDVGASFTAVQSITHARGTFLGTVTIDGYMVLDAGSATITGNEILATATVRDARDNLIAVTSIGGTQPAMTANRAVAAPISAPLPVAAAPEPPAVLAGSIYDLSPSAAEPQPIASNPDAVASNPDPASVLAGDIYDVGPSGGGGSIKP